MNRLQRPRHLRRRGTWDEPVTLTRKSQEAVIIEATIHPGRGSWYTGHLDADVEVEQGDTITWKGKNYEVRVVRDWNSYLEVRMVPVR